MQTVIPLNPGVCYHIYNRGVNRENIFREARNYPYFLQLYHKHITPIAETFAYCLLRNHFHFLVRIRTQSQIEIPSQSITVTPVIAAKAFNSFLAAYAQAINKAYGRTGALFQHHFKRHPVASVRYFAALVRYIHQNLVKHGFVKDFRQWPYSSYHCFVQTTITPKPTSPAANIVARDVVLAWFGGYPVSMTCTLW